VLDRHLPVEPDVFAVGVAGAAAKGDRVADRPVFAGDDHLWQRRTFIARKEGQPGLVGIAELIGHAHAHRDVDRFGEQQVGDRRVGSLLEVAVAVQIP
jgi:hypothetical protein